MKVLVVDDDCADVMRAILEELGHQAVTTIDGDHALHLLAEQPFDVVITDVFHRGPEGPAIARASLGRAARAIVCSAAPITDCPDGAVCVQKPVLIDAWLALLGEA